MKLTMTPDQGETTGAKVMPDGPINPSAFSPSEPTSNEELYGKVVNAPVAQAEEAKPEVYGTVAPATPPAAQAVTEDPDLVGDRIEKVRTYFGRIEGTRPHVGADAQNLTLPFGIVPDSVMVNGQEVKAGQNTLANSALESNPDQVELMTATKKVGNTLYKASDYNSYQEFSDAVLGAFESELTTKYPDIPEAALPMMLSSMWNVGVDSGLGGWSGFKSTLAELNKPEGSRDLHALVGMGKHSFTGGKSSVGLLKRRMEDLNLSLPPSEQIAKVDQRTVNGKPVMRVFDRDGNVIRTFNFTKDSINSDQTIDLEIDPLDEPEEQYSPEGEGNPFPEVGAPESKPEPTPLTDGIYEDNGKQVRIEGGRMYDLRTGKRLDVEPVQDTGPDAGTVRDGKGGYERIVLEGSVQDNLAGSGNADLEAIKTGVKELTGANLGPNVMTALENGDTGAAAMEVALEAAGPLGDFAKGMFLGLRRSTKGLTTDIGERMFEMFKSGKSNKEIKKSLGGFIGKDDLPRIEISDRNAVLNDDFRFDFESGLGSAKSYKLGGIFTHHELYKEYPDLKDITVEFLPSGSKNAGSFNSSTGVLKIRKGDSADEVRKTVLHELQHQIQEMEGFVTGGASMPKTVKQDVLVARQRLDDIRFQYPELLEWSDFAISNIGRSIREGNPSPLLERLSPEARTALVRFAPSYTVTMDAKNEAFQKYLRGHGEAEARVVEGSSNMTQAQLDETMPFERGVDNFNIPEDEIIVDGIRRGSMRGVVK